MKGYHISKTFLTLDKNSFKTHRRSGCKMRRFTSSGAYQSLASDSSAFLTGEILGAVAFECRGLPTETSCKMKFVASARQVSATQALHDAI
jgi:hypothetical protein